MKHRFVKKKQFISTIFLMTILIFSLASCSKNESSSVQSKIEISRENRNWMDSFFRGVFLHESAIFTLWGSKPMTFINAAVYTEEQLKEWKEWLNNRPEEEKKTDSYYGEDFEVSENWEKWEEISLKFPIEKYLFFKNPSFWDKDIPLIYFVDILQTALMIEKHHDLFFRITNIDFHALDVVFEIKNPESKFWNAVFNSPVLTGLVLGFGEKNSWCFEWEHSIKCDGQLDRAFWFAQTLLKNFSCTFGQGSTPANPCKISIKNFGIPQFASFYPKGQDPIIFKYEQERDQIQKIYEGKDFLDLTLSRLMQ